MRVCLPRDALVSADHQRRRHFSRPRRRVSCASARRLLASLTFFGSCALAGAGLHRLCCGAAVDRSVAAGAVPCRVACAASLTPVQTLRRCSWSTWARPTPCSTPPKVRIRTRALHAQHCAADAPRSLARAQQPAAEQSVCPEAASAGARQLPRHFAALCSSRITPITRVVSMRTRMLCLQACRFTPASPCARIVHVCFVALPYLPHCIGPHCHHRLSDSPKPPTCCR